MKAIPNIIIPSVIIIFLLAACAPAAVSTPETPAAFNVEQTSTPVVTQPAASTPTVTPVPIPPNHPGWMPEGVIARFGMGTYRNMTVSPDNSMVAVAGTSGVHIVDPQTGHTVDFLETGADAEDAAFSPDGQRLYIGLGHEGVAIWIHDSMNAWKNEELFPTPCAAQVDVSPNGDILFTKCYAVANSKFIAWDIASKTQRYQSNYSKKDMAFTMAFSPVNPNLMAISTDYTVSLMEIGSGKVINTFSEPKKNSVMDLDFSPDGSLLAITSGTREVILLNVENASESGRIRHTANVLQFSFIDNDTVVSVVENFIVIEEISGRVIRKIDHSIYDSPVHAYVPEQNVFVTGDNGSLISISLDTYKVIGKVDGFNLYTLNSYSISGNGNAFITGNILIHPGDFTDFTRIDTNKICNFPTDYFTFMDNDGKYIFFHCGKDEVLTAEIETMRVVSSYKSPLAYTSNTMAGRHSWPDDRELLAMLYENPGSSPAKYRVEIWNSIQNKKISSLDVDIPEYQIPDIRGTRLIFSPRSKYLVVVPPEGKSILSYDIDSGALVQNITLNTPRPLVNVPNIEEMFLDDDTTFFMRYDNFVDVYSIESGELLQKISNLKLHQWKSAETFSIDLFNNFTYFNETKTFMTYGQSSDRNNLILDFNSYSLETGEKIATSSIQLPYKLKNGEKVDRKKYALAIEYVYLPVEKNGNVVVVGANLHSSGSNVNDYTIYVVDISSNKIIKSYTWQQSEWNLSFFAFKDFMITGFRPIHFLWDISTP